MYNALLKVILFISVSESDTVAGFFFKVSLTFSSNYRLIWTSQSRESNSCLFHVFLVYTFVFFAYLVILLLRLRFLLLCLRLFVGKWFAKSVLFNRKLVFSHYLPPVLVFSLKILFFHQESSCIPGRDLEPEDLAADKSVCAVEERRGLNTRSSSDDNRPWRPMWCSWMSVAGFGICSTVESRARIKVSEPRKLLRLPFWRWDRTRTVRIPKDKSPPFI